VLQQLAQHVGAQAVGAFHEFTRFLQGLAHAHVAQQLQQRALRRRHLRRPAALLERANVQQGGRLLVEQPFAVVLGREALGEPFRQARGRPAIQVQHRLLRTYWRTPYQSSADLPPTCSPSNWRCNSNRLGCSARVSFGRQNTPRARRVSQPART
jgi:hypothetical protein